MRIWCLSWGDAEKARLGRVTTRGDEDRIRCCRGPLRSRRTGAVRAG
jgi:hypothetical protein